MSLSLVTAPVSAPLSLNVVKQHLKIENTATDDDALIDALIQVATEYVEHITGRALITQTWDYYLDRFPPCTIDVPKGRLQSVTSITYQTGGSPDTETLASDKYQVDAISEPARITPSWGNIWPCTLYVVNAVRIRMVCGYGDDWNSVPQAIRQALLLIIGHYYENRESVTAMPAGMTLVEVPQAVSALLWPYRLMRWQ